MTAPDAPVWPYAEFIGCRVEAVLDRGPVSDTVQLGRLLSTTDDGEFQIEDDNGVIHFCWPLLDIREVATCDVPYTGSNWHAERCERGPGHERSHSFHCDRFGRTW